MSSPTTLLTGFRTALRAFAASEVPLRILRTVPAATAAAAPQQLLVLDSSFNPPTRAHLHLAAAALSAYDARSRPTRLVLLLATQNADKPAQPAAWEHRLCMMARLADAVVKVMQEGVSGHASSPVSVDIGVTKLPYFIDKTKALGSRECYTNGVGPDGQPVPQVHLVGYDTLIRIFDPKYYPPDHTLAPLHELFDHHRLRVMCRPNAGWGGHSEQQDYVEAIRRGQRANEGARSEWASQIELVEHETLETGTISSTKIRHAAAALDWDGVDNMCPLEVANWIRDQGLYRDDST